MPKLYCQLTLLPILTDHTVLAWRAEARNHGFESTKADFTLKSAH